MEKFSKVICTTCGEIYDLTDPTFKELPLECCGECGGLHFVNQSYFPEEGFINIKHYNMSLSLIPKILRTSLDKFIEENTFPNFPSTHTKYLHLSK